MTSATEVMGNFQSDSILHERITVSVVIQSPFELWSNACVDAAIFEAWSIRQWQGVQEAAL